MSGAYRLSLNPDQLMQMAQAVAGVSHVDEAARLPLVVLVKSFNEDARLHEIGARRIESKLIRMLANRLRMIRDFAAHPEIREQPLRRPIFIAGSVRTGSTKMQRLLAAADDFNWLPLWKAMNSASYAGVRSEDPAPRIADAEAYIAEFYEGSPEARATHEQGVHLAEEESYIFMQDFRCPGYMGLANVPGYLQWLALQDMTSAYEYLRDVLKYLQWQGLANSSKRWLLKCPFHCGMEPILGRIFPDASLIVTHRPPHELMPSMCSMLSTYIQSHSDHTTVDAHALVEGFAASLERHLDFRRAQPEFPILDVHYKDTTQHIREVIDRVYGFLDVSLTPESLDRMLTWDSLNPIHRHGAHRYTLADFDLSRQAIDSQCPNYLRFYAERFGQPHQLVPGVPGRDRGYAGLSAQDADDDA